jgi:N-dimethylarginine dimethylaminohydrolase
MTQINGDEGKALPPERQSQEFELTEYDAHQERQRRRNWTLHDVPFYKGKGQSLEQNPFDWHHFDYLNYYDQVYGRKSGSAGIGKLREAALVAVSDDDDFTKHPYYKENPGYFPRISGNAAATFDLARLRHQQDAYAEILTHNGVKLYWLKFPRRPIGVYGPMTNLLSAGDLMVIPGGSIIAKPGYSLAPTSGFGRVEHLGRWAFWNLSIPPLLTVIGNGAWTPGVFLADDVYVQALSVETNEDGMRQVEPVLRRQCGKGLHIQLIYAPDHQYYDPATGISARADMVVAPLDVKTVLVHTPGIDLDCAKWLWDNGYKVIEVEPEERNALPCNLMPLEAGHVVMNAKAPRTIAKVGRSGIQVSAVDYGEYNALGAGLRAATLQILRDEGPRRFT